MDNDIKTWLFDILNSIIEIESYFVDQPKQFSNYQKDLRTKRAIERNIEIIGEAMNRILLQNDETEITVSHWCKSSEGRLVSIDATVLLSGFYFNIIFQSEIGSFST